MEKAGDALGHRLDALQPSGPCSKTPTMPANKRVMGLVVRMGSTCDVLTPMVVKKPSEDYTNKFQFPTRCT